MGPTSARSLRQAWACPAFGASDHGGLVGGPGDDPALEGDREGRPNRVDVEITNDKSNAGTRLRTVAFPVNETPGAQPVGVLGATGDVRLPGLAGPCAGGASAYRTHRHRQEPPARHAGVARGRGRPPSPLIHRRPKDAHCAVHHALNVRYPFASTTQGLQCLTRPFTSLALPHLDDMSGLKAGLP
jgi:hypothetical protein